MTWSIAILLAQALIPLFLAVMLIRDGSALSLIIAVPNILYATGIFYLAIIEFRHRV